MTPPDFCRSCGGRFPHRYGEARCDKCLPRAFAELERRLTSTRLALRAAESALVDLGACDDQDCREPNCVHALAKVRDALCRLAR